MLNSNFISGHFARYPIDLFKSNGLNLKTICLFRNPVDRILSQFNYEHYFNNWKNKINTNPKFDDLLEYIYVPGRYLANLQARSVCSTIDINESKRITKLFLSDMITAETLFDKIAKTGFLNYKF